jgi:AbrB family looped-hinge helix DNA binding protein
MTSRVGERGQITIEKAIREELGIYAGDEAVQRIENGRIVIDVVPGRHRRSLAGSLREKTTRRPGPRGMIGVDTSVLVRYLVGSPPDEAQRAAALIDGDDTELGVSIVALAECAHVLRTQYGVDQRDIIDSLIGLVQRENIRVLGINTSPLVEMLARARALPGRPIPDAMIVAASVAADALPLATFDRDQRRYGVAVHEP